MKTRSKLALAINRSRYLKVFSIIGMASCMNSNAVEVDKDLQDYDGSHGFWLRTPLVEAFVAVEPQFRILAAKRPGHASLLADRSIKEQGLRLACMEPEQIPSSFDVGNQPARILARTTSSTRLQLAAAGGLGYTVTISLKPGRSRLNLEYELENRSKEPRKIAAWSLMSFAPGGSIMVPFGGPHSRRKLVFPWWSTWPQPEVNIGTGELLVGTLRPASGDACKIGIITRSGWVAFIRGDEVIVSSSTFMPEATYPEDGANISVFKSGAGGKGRCETEQMSPLTEIQPGKALRFQETLDLFTTQHTLPEEARELRKFIDQKLQDQTQGSPE